MTMTKPSNASSKTSPTKSRPLKAKSPTKSTTSKPTAHSPKSSEEKDLIPTGNNKSLISEFNDAAMQEEKAYGFQGGFKDPAEAWNEMTTPSKRNCQPCLRSERTQIEVILDEALSKSECTDDEMNIARWESFFSETIKVRSNKNWKKKHQLLAMSLASSNPQDFFSEEEFDGRILLDSTLARAWTGAYHLFGAAWKDLSPTVELKSILAMEVTQFWHKLKPQDAIQKPFEKNDIFSDSGDSIHD